nr:hypothetical protein [Candidatus Kapabacteria bacterium]
EILEAYIEQDAEENESSEFFDELEIYLTNPLNLRKTSIKQLSKLPEISVNLASKILRLVKKQNFTSIDKIADTLELSFKQIRILKLLTIIEDVEAKNQKIDIKYRARNKIDFNEAKGFENGKYLGSHLSLYQRFNTENDKYKIGFLTKKNAGEKSLAEFYSGYIAADFDNLKVLIGDYSLRQGMGNLLWSNYRNSKSSDVISPALQYRSGFLPYHSSTDYKFLRGAALDYKLNLTDSSSLTFSLSYSKINRSAAIDTSLGIATSIYTAGYYRTETEIAKKRKLPETCFSSSLQFENTNFSIGATILNLNYEYPIESEAKTAFSGKEGLLGSLYSMYNSEDFSVAFEVSQDAKHNLGFKAGSIYKIEDVELSFHYRNFSSEFRSPFGIIFGETYAPSNETGFYTGVKWYVNPKLILSSYFDIWKTHTKTYTLPIRQKGIELFSEANYLFDSDFELLTRIKYENKTDAITIDKLKSTFQKGKYTFRVELKYQIDELTRLRLRNEDCLITYEDLKANETGMLFFCDLQRKIFSNLDIYGRLTYYSTDSYDSAIWQYEASPTGYSVSYALYGQGIRAYLGFEYKLFNILEFSAKYTVVSKNFVESIGSGLDEIQGSSKQQLFFQIDVRF